MTPTSLGEKINNRVVITIRSQIESQSRGPQLNFRSLTGLLDYASYYILTSSNPRFGDRIME
jgi:predicted transcriptional regulator